MEKRRIVATVLRIAVLILFQSHVYTFGGKSYLQKHGGPIGLRSTCCIARITMLWWDEQWLKLVGENNLELEAKARYIRAYRQKKKSFTN